jgi:hypothetical protein
MMQRHSPEFAQAQQVAREFLQFSHGRHFWYVAREHGWRPARNISNVVADKPETAIESSGKRLSKMEADELLRQLRDANILRYNIFTQQIERKGKVLEGAEHYYLEIAEHGYKISKRSPLIAWSK